MGRRGEEREEEGEEGGSSPSCQSHLLTSCVTVAMKRDVSRMRWMCFIQPDASSPARNPEIDCVGKHTADRRVESVCVCEETVSFK